MRRSENMKKTILLSLVLAVVVGLSGCNYNSLTAKQQGIKGKWANVESQLQRRADLIDNLVEVAKGVAFNEQAIFGQIAEARSKLLDASKAAPAGADGDKSPEQKQAIIDANNSLGGTIGRLLSISENYPNLRSNENFLLAQTEITGTENRINVARLDYNDAVTSYNTERAQFPGIISASIFGFKEEPFFKAEEGAKTTPKIDMSDMKGNKK
jgi:LemA protein